MLIHPAIHDYDLIVAVLLLVFTNHSFFDEYNTVENNRHIGVLIPCIYFRVLIGLFNHEITPLINWNT